VHGQYGGSQNIDFVYFLRRHHSHGPSQSIALYLLAKFVAAASGKLFGIVDFVIFIVGQKYDGCGIDAPGQTAAPGFVATGLYFPFMQE
jgi:hypothetical protein